MRESGLYELQACSWLSPIATTAHMPAKEGGNNRDSQGPSRWSASCASSLPLVKGYSMQHVDRGRLLLLKGDFMRVMACMR